MRLNYYYNFKNTVRFFMNIDNLDYNSVNDEERTWSSPFKFRIRKDDKSFRTLYIPNIYNFKNAYNYYEKSLKNNGLDFEKLEELDSNKRMKISYKLGEFKEKSYDEWQLDDYNKLIKYDILIRCDIKSFYKNIYTHYIFNDLTNVSDRPIYCLNNGRTAGLIMGNYLSLFSAELLSAKISSKLEEKISDSKIKCEFSYFSDDFYFFTNYENKEKVINIFDEVLEKFDLEKNEEKVKIYDYLSYTNDDIIEKFWKKLTRESKEQQYEHLKEIEQKKRKYDNNLFITNQLVYRLNKLDEYKKKRVFIVNFFKSNFFRNIDFRNTFLSKYNYHQILYLIREFPEIILYISKIFDSFDEFKSEKFINTIKDFYIDSLKSNYFEEQLYYLYLLNRLNSLKKIKSKDICDLVFKTENVILIAYYIENEMLDEEHIEKIKNYDDESYWLVYYYLIKKDLLLYLDLEKSIERYLIPRNAKGTISIAYKNFYLDNLRKKNDILVDLNEVEDLVNIYFDEKYNFDEEIDFDEEEYINETYYDEDLY